VAFEVGAVRLGHSIPRNLLYLAIRQRQSAAHRVASGKGSDNFLIVQLARMKGSRESEQGVLSRPVLDRGWGLEAPPFFAGCRYG
jgi:hypothetical protein